MKGSSYTKRMSSTSIVLGECSDAALKRHMTVTSKGKDYTYLYGKTIAEGSLTPYIDQVFNDVDR